MDFHGSARDGDEGGGERPDEPVRVAGPLEQHARLRSAQVLIEKKLKAITEAHLAIVDELESVREVMPTSKLRAFLVAECGLDRGDVRAYLKFNETLGEHREAIADKAVSFPAVKALVGAPEHVRREAVERIELGSFVHARDVAVIRRRFVEQAEGPKVAAERQRRKALRAAAQKKAQAELDAFGREFLPFVTTLVDFYNAGIDEDVTQETYDATRASLMADAARCLAPLRRPVRRGGTSQVVGVSLSWQSGRGRAARPRA